MTRDDFILALVNRGWPMALALQEVQRLEESAERVGYAEGGVGRYRLVVWRGEHGGWRYGLWSGAEVRLRRRLEAAWKRANAAVARLLGPRP